MNPKPLIIDHQVALEKAARYCAYQERCHQDIERKLKDWNVDPEIQDDVISELIQQNFLNEERFALTYVRGKVNIKKWGRYKIKLELKSRQVSEYSINKALKEIDEENYILNLQEVLEKKRTTVTGKSAYEIRAKIFQYLLSKGYEAQLINEQLDNYGITG